MNFSLTFIIKYLYDNYLDKWSFYQKLIAEMTKYLIIYLTNN